MNRTRKSKARHHVYKDHCVICGVVCDASNLEEWAELLCNKRTVRACTKHAGVVEEFEHQMENKDE